MEGPRGRKGEGEQLRRKEKLWLLGPRTPKEMPLPPPRAFPSPQGAQLKFHLRGGALQPRPLQNPYGITLLAHAPSRASCLTPAGVVASALNYLGESRSSPFTG